MKAISGLQKKTIDYSDDIVRQVVECVRVLSADEIEITFKGGLKHNVPLAH